MSSPETATLSQSTEDNRIHALSVQKGNNHILQPSTLSTLSTKEAVEHASCQIITIADLNSESLNHQAAIIEALVSHKNIPVRTNKVENFNLTAAAHTLSAYVEDVPSSCKAIFVITVDPHVGQNDANDSNIGSKRVIVKYPSGLILVGPARWYMRVPGLHGHGDLSEAEVYEINLENLIQLGLTEKRGGDVFDGASKFAPAGAGIAKGYTLDQLGSRIENENIQKEIESIPLRPGDLTESCEFGNLRVEFDESQFQKGDSIAVHDQKGVLLCIAKRTDAFSEDKGEIVAVNGSKKMITDHTKRALYLAAVQGNLAEIIAGKRGKPVQVGEHLSITKATSQEVAEWQRYVIFQKVNLLVRELVQQKVHEVRDGVVTNPLISSLLNYVYDKLK